MANSYHAGRLGRCDCRFTVVEWRDMCLPFWDMRIGPDVLSCLIMDLMDISDFVYAFL